MQVRSGRPRCSVLRCSLRLLVVPCRGLGIAKKSGLADARTSEGTGRVVSTGGNGYMKRLLIVGALLLSAAISASGALADGTETLGPPSVAISPSATKVLSAGV